MDTVDLPRFFLACIFILGLIGVFALALKRYGKGGGALSGQQGQGRLQVVEVRYLDARRKLVLVKRDDAEHLLLLADGRELVIEQGIAKRDERD